MSPRNETKTWPAALTGVLAFVFIALVAYSQTKAFAWDEGFHVLTAYLIEHGKRPYIDFMFSQTPLNAYWNAGWMFVLGESWRVPHAVAAVCTAVSVVLTAGFVFLRFPDSEWRLRGAILAALLMGLNPLVFRYGGIAQAYGLCLAAVVSGWLLSLRSVEDRGLRCAGFAGLACGASAGSSLLTMPVGPILLVWTLWCNRAGNRWRKAAAFAAGELVAFIPLLPLLAQGPRQVWFGVVEYNLYYRELNWPGAADQNLQVLKSWTHSVPALVLLSLSLTGLWYVRFRSGWEPRRRAEFYLCGWMSAILAVHLSIAKPTFQRYYLFTVPFLSVLAATGACAICRLIHIQARRWVAGSVAALAFAGIGLALYDEGNNMDWSDLETTAGQVRAVTTPDQRLGADEAIYFLTKHLPPSGMEMRDSHKFDFQPDKLSLLHLIPQAALDRQVKAGAFDVLESCEDEDYLDEHDYEKVYARHVDAGECTVYWQKRDLVETSQPAGAHDTSRATVPTTNRR